MYLFLNPLKTLRMEKEEKNEKSKIEEKFLKMKDVKISGIILTSCLIIVNILELFFREPKISTILLYLNITLSSILFIIFIYYELVVISKD